MIANISSYPVQDEQNNDFLLHERKNSNDQELDISRSGYDNELHTLARTHGNGDDFELEKEFPGCKPLGCAFKDDKESSCLTRWVCYPWGNQEMRVVTCLAFSSDESFVACGTVARYSRAPVSVFSLKKHRGWEAGMLVVEFKEHVNMISSLSFLPNTNTCRLVVTDCDGLVVIYDVFSQKANFIDRGHPSKINCHAVLCQQIDATEYSTTIGIGTVDRKVRFYNIEKFEAYNTHIKYEAEVRALEMTVMDFKTRNLKVVVVGGSQHHISLYKEDPSEVNKFEFMMRIPVQGHTNCMSISGTNFIPHGKAGGVRSCHHLAFGGLDKQVTVIELESSSGMLEWEYFGSFPHEAPVASCSLSSDGVSLAVGDDAGKVKLYNVNTGAHVFGHSFSDRIKGVELSADGRLLAVGGFDCQLHITDIHEGFELFLTLHHNSQRQVQSVSVSEDGCFLAIATHDGYVFVYSMEQNITGNQEKPNGRFFWRRSPLSCQRPPLTQVFDHKMEKEVWVVELSRDGSIVAFGGYDRKAMVYEVHGKKLLCTFEQEWLIWSLSLYIDTSCLYNSDERLSFGERVAVSALQHPDARSLIAVGDWTGSVSVYDMKTQKSIYATHLGDRVFSVVFSQCGNYLAVGGRAGVAQYHSLPKKDLRNRITTKGSMISSYQMGDRVYCIALSPNGHLMAVGGVMNEVVLYDLRENLERARFPAPMITNYVEFTPDGTLLAFGGDQKTVYIYCTQTFERVLQLPQEDAITSISFSLWGCMAVAVGDRIMVYGQGRLHHGVGSEPSFNLAQTLLNDTHALRTMLRTYPEVANRYDPVTFKTLLHMAVEKKSEETVMELLAADTVIGLSRDSDRKTALDLAIQHNYKEITKLILQGILDKKFGTQPDSLEPLFSHEDVEVTSHRELKPTSPVWRSPTIPRIKTSNLDSSTSGPPQHYRTIDALGERFPDVLVHFLTCFREEEAEHLVIGSMAVAPIRKTLYLTCKKRVPLSLWVNYFEQFAEQQSSDPLSPEVFWEKAKQMIGRFMGWKTQTNYDVEVKAFRLPIKDFAHNLDLSKIIKLVDRTMDYKIFDDHTIVTAALSFKWQTCKEKFHQECLRYLIFLCLCSTWLFTASQSACQDWSALVNDTNGQIALVLFPVILGCSCFSIFHHTRQRFRYDSWRLLKLVSFLALVVVICCFALRSRPFPHYASFCQILLFMNLLTYAKCYDKCAVPLQVVQQMFMEVVPLLTISFVMIMGFSLSFLTLFGPISSNQEMAGSSTKFFQNPLHSFFASSLMMFGDFFPIEFLYRYNLDDSYTGCSMIIVELFLCGLILLLLNTIVAKMNRVFEEVENRAKFQARYEKAKMILEIDSGSFYQPWLHALKPVEQYFPNTNANKRAKPAVHDVDDTSVSSLDDIKASVLLLSKRVDELSQKFERNLHNLKPNN